MPRNTNLRRRPSSTRKVLDRKRHLNKPLPAIPTTASYRFSQFQQTPCHPAADLQCLHSLPVKIQQLFLSPEELFYLHHPPPPRDSYREELARQSFETRPSDTTTNHSSQSSAPYLESPSSSDSECDSDWATDTESDDENMDHSLYDSFRWLDDDDHLDLTLEEYNNRSNTTTNASPPKPRQPRRKPSFRRTMSFTSANRARRALSSSISHPVGPGSSQSSTVPSALANKGGRDSTSRPPSGQPRPVLHAPRSSTSSIDPSARYYQDPEARLKLRVFLASPQKFDEAIKFGFPALDDDKKDDNDRPGRPENAPERPSIPAKAQKITGTFFEDEDGAVHGQRNDRKSARLSIKSPQSLPSPASAPNTLTKRQSGRMAASRAGPRRLPGDREMTLKMTLTRPELRTDSPSTSPTSVEDPLKPADLSPASPQIWDTDLEDQNVMKKMWRKLRKQKY